jgi:hypothetical protein
MHFRNCLISTFIILTLLGLSAFPANITREDNLFKQGIGARTLAMGNAFTGIADDVNSVLYNPAGIGRVKELELLGLSSKRLVDVDASTVLLAYPTETWGTFTFGTMALDVPSIALAGWDVNTNQIYQAGTATYGERLWLLGWGNKLTSNVSWGFNLKSYRIAFDTNTAGYTSEEATGYDADIGLLWAIDGNLSLGLMWQNCASTLFSGGGLHWSTDADETFDGGPRCGFGYNWAWFDGHSAPLFLSLDVECSRQYPALKHFGAEWWMFDLLALRTGLNEKLIGIGHTQMDGVLGLGLKIFDLRVDYAYYPNYGESVDVKHFVSVSGFFDIGVGRESPRGFPVETGKQTAKELRKLDEMTRREIYGPAGL